MSYLIARDLDGKVVEIGRQARAHERRVAQTRALGRGAHPDSDPEVSRLPNSGSALLDRRNETPSSCDSRATLRAGVSTTTFSPPPPVETTYPNSRSLRATPGRGAGTRTEVDADHHARAADVG